MKLCELKNDIMFKVYLLEQMRYNPELADLFTFEPCKLSPDKETQCVSFAAMKLSDGYIKIRATLLDSSSNIHVFRTMVILKKENKVAVLKDVFTIDILNYLPAYLQSSFSSAICDMDHVWFVTSSLLSKDMKSRLVNEGVIGLEVDVPEPYLKTFEQSV
jgi:hypothetical protein